LGHFTVFPAAALGARNDLPQPEQEIGIFSDLFCGLVGAGLAVAACGAAAGALGAATGLATAGFAVAVSVVVVEAAGTSFNALHDGQRAFLPAAVSGT